MTTDLYCQFWCKPHNKAEIVCEECGLEVFDSQALFCNLCSSRQHKQKNHKTRSIEDNPKLTRSYRLMTSSTKSGGGRTAKSVLLVDDNEKLCVAKVGDLSRELGVSADVSLNVISIFGNTGDGKSHTLNHVFFDGDEVFQTSSSQKPGTVGMWVAYDNTTNTLVIDTEGLLGASSNLNRRTRLLLKILALSDIAVYRTRAERLHNDMFSFLSDASTVYCEHFSADLKSVMKKHAIDVPISSLGPKALIFHETQYTEPLDSTNDQVLTDDQNSDSITVNVDDEIFSRFDAIGTYPQAFSKIRYIGTKSRKGPTDFEKLRNEILSEINGNTMRNRKSLKVIMESLQLLNSKFSNDIPDRQLCTFSDDFFRCTLCCLCCGEQCTLSVSHTEPHRSSNLYCRYQHQYQNKIYICGKCYNNGKRREVLPKSYEENEGAISGLMKLAWSGYVIECEECGVIYRSRQYWYGNKAPEQTSVRTEIVHLWPGEEQRPENTGRYVLDQISMVTETIGQYSAGPTQMVADWIQDQIAPPYWVPNNLITECYMCKVKLGLAPSKHHCRSCGQGFCKDCTNKSKPVEWRGWGAAPVRVCNSCFSKPDNALEEEFIGSITAWKVTEALKSVGSVVKTVVEVPANLVTDAVRPDYWVPDVDIIECYGCKEPIEESKHHCRSCGQGFCEECCRTRKPVPERGWDYPVRVCGDCANLLL